MIAAKVGSARKYSSPNPRRAASAGIGLVGVATSQFQAVDETTIGTTQGSISSTLNTVFPGTLVRSSSARPIPTSQLPNTPTTVKMTVNRAAFQNRGLVEHVDVVGQADELAGHDQRAVTDRLQRGDDQRVGVDQQQQHDRRRDQQDHGDGAAARARGSGRKPAVPRIPCLAAGRGT